jgi:hypothetical protein
MWYHVPSSAFAPEPVPLTSELCLALAQSATWNTRHQPPKSWRRVLTMVPYMTRRSGLISTPSMAALGVASWLASLAAIHASRSALPASDSESRTPGTFGVAEGLYTAAEVGATHGRERLYILAHHSGRGTWSISGRQRRAAPSIARILGECEPDWCVFENVGGHLRLGYFDVVRPDLERLGYRIRRWGARRPTGRHRTLRMRNHPPGGQPPRGSCIRG